jgi:hypothetical protein
MSVGEIHLDDVGTVFEATIKDQDEQIVDVSSATTIEFIFKRPAGTTFSKDGELVTDGKDGKVRCITVTDDLTPVGDWEYQAYVELPSGTWHSDIHAFTVHRNL